jgi:hypothetical protein
MMRNSGRKDLWRIQTFQRRAAALLAAATVSVAPAWAEDSSSHSTPAAAHGASGGQHFHPNELALFLGGTREGAVDESFFTVGGEYERRFNPHWGLSMVAEYISDADSWVVVFPFILRPVPGYGLKLFAGPGFQNKPPHHHADAHEEMHLAAAEPGPVHENEEGRETFFLLRVGAGYSFEFGERYSLTPALALDLTRENDEWKDGLVFGLTFGIGF